MTPIDQPRAASNQNLLRTSNPDRWLLCDQPNHANGAQSATRHNSGRQPAGLDCSDDRLKPLSNKKPRRLELPRLPMSNTSRRPAAEVRPNRQGHGPGMRPTKRRRDATIGRQTHRWSRVSNKNARPRVSSIEGVMLAKSGVQGSRQLEVTRGPPRWSTQPARWRNPLRDACRRSRVVCLSVSG